MNVELEPSMNTNDPVVVAFDPDNIPDLGFSVGFRRYQGKPGVFQYEWMLEYLTHDEVRELVATLSLALTLAPDDDTTVGVS